MLENTISSSKIEQSYDDIPYESNPFSDTSPSHLASVARLFGLSTIDTTKARVLELGCSSGGNIIPHAVRNPKSEYIGVDLSKVQIDKGQKKINALKLNNIKLKHISISDINADFGKFDYIIAHGVFSWIPEEVQQDILRICSQNLSSKGIAFISYNVYPGWKVKEVVRDAMMLRGSTQNDPYQKLAHARGMINFLHEMAVPNSMMQSLINSEIDLIRNANPYYLAHEYLEHYNQPYYFKDFIAKAEAHDLCYVSEAEVSTIFPSNLGQKVAAPLLQECGHSQILLEQYMDFVKNRPFRQTILTHKNRANKINYKIQAEDIKEFEYFGRYSTKLEVQGNTADGFDHLPLEFTNQRGIKLNVSQPIEKAALITISEAAPNSINFRQIVQGAQKRLGSKLPTHNDVICSLLEQLIIKGLIKFTLTPANANSKIDEKPLVEKSVRYDAENQPQVGTANLWHDPLKLELVQQHILPKLDGNHNKEQIVKHVLSLVKDNVLNFSRNGAFLTDPKDIKQAAIEHVEISLEFFRLNALLINKE